MRKVQLTTVFPFGSMQPETMVGLVESLLRAHRIPATKFKFYLKEATPAQIVRSLAKTKRRTFHLTAMGYEFHLSAAANYQIDVFEI